MNHIHFQNRLLSVDLMRGFVMVLMMIDHTSMAFSSSVFAIDTASQFQPGMTIPPGPFLLRWMTHLCAPTFLLLSGFSMALGFAKRESSEQPSFDRHIFLRGLVLIFLDLTWNSFVFGGFSKIYFGVLFAIGASMCTMVLLRHLPISLLSLVCLSLFVGVEPLYLALGGSETSNWVFHLLVARGPVGDVFYCIYPVLPWLPYVIVGWIYATFYLSHLRLKLPEYSFLIGSGSLVLFAILRFCGNYGSLGIGLSETVSLSWLAVSKYPPSLQFATLELGLFFLCFSLFQYISARSWAWWLHPVRLFGQSALFFYLVHAYFVFTAAKVLGAKFEVASVVGISTAGLFILYWPCTWFLKIKKKYPAGILRFI